MNKQQTLQFLKSLRTYLLGFPAHLITGTLKWATEAAYEADVQAAFRVTPDQYKEMGLPDRQKVAMFLPVERVGYLASFHNAVPEGTYVGRRTDTSAMKRVCGPLNHVVPTQRVVITEDILPKPEPAEVN